MSIEDYYKEIEIAMIWTNMEEDREATITRFFSRLNKNITNIIKLHYCIELEDIVSIAMMVET